MKKQHHLHFDWITGGPSMSGFDAQGEHVLMRFTITEARTAAWRLLAWAEYVDRRGRGLGARQPGRMMAATHPLIVHHKMLGTAGYGELAQPSVASQESCQKDGAAADLARLTDADQPRNGGLGTASTDSHGGLSETPTD